MLEIEIRCPNGPKRLFAILQQLGERPKIVEGNLFEVACPDCARLMRKAGFPVFRVLHRYDLAGELIETLEVPIET